jgi:hypothetical protein
MACEVDQKPTGRHLASGSHYDSQGTSFLKFPSLTIPKGFGASTMAPIPEQVL